MKGLWETLNAKKKITSNTSFVFLLCTHFEIEEDVFQSDLWPQLDNNNCSRVTINQFCDFCLMAMEMNSSLSDTVLQIFDSVENPQTVAAIQATRKKLYASLVNMLNTRNETVKKRIFKNSQATCGCLLLIVSLIIVPFFPPVLIITLIALIIFFMAGYRINRLGRLPMPELNAVLKHK